MPHIDLQDLHNFPLATALTSEIYPFLSVALDTLLYLSPKLPGTISPFTLDDHLLGCDYFEKLSLAIVPFIPNIASSLVAAYFFS